MQIGNWLLSMTAVWGIAIIAFLLLEGMTTGLVSIWFAVGALAALLSSLG